MALRFLADHCISNFIVQVLQDAGHDVVRLREALPVESADALVIAKAQEMGAILLSLNGDFADIVTYPPKRHQGIVAIQLRNHSEVLPQLMKRMIAFIGLHTEMADFSGKLVVVEVDRIRIRE